MDKNYLEIDDSHSNLNGLPEIAIIGLGRWGGGPLLNTLKQFPVTIHAVAKSNYKNWKEKKDTKELPENILVYSSEKYDEEILKNKNIRAVVISTQFSTHFELSKQALLSGKDVFVEKPFTRTFRQAKELLEIAEKNGCILTIGYEYRYSSNIRWLGEVIRRDELGKITEIELNMLNPLDNRKLDMSSNVCEDLASHMLSLLHSLFGERDISELRVDTDIPCDMAKISFKYCKGYNQDIKVCINVDRNYKGNNRNRTIILKTTKLVLILDYQKSEVEVLDINGSIISDLANGLSRELLQEVEDKSNLELEFEDFLQAVKSRQAGINSAQSLLCISETIEWINELMVSCQNGWQDKELKWILRHRPNIVEEVYHKLLYEPWLSFSVIASQLNLSLSSLQKILEKILEDPLWCEKGKEEIRNGRFATASYFSNTERFADVERIYKVIRGEKYLYPKKVEFHVGVECPANCVFCYRNINGQRQAYELEIKDGFSKLTPDDYVRLLKELADNGTSEIYVSGGLEPLTDFDSTGTIINYAISRGLFVFLYSNKVYRVSNDPARSKMIFYKVLGRVKNLVKEKRKLGSKTQIGIQILLTLTNFQEIIQLAKLSDSIGVDFLDIRSDYMGIVRFSHEEKAELARLLYLTKEKQEKGEFGSLRISVPDNFKLIGDNGIIGTSIYVFPEENYSKRGIFFFELTIDPFGIVFGTTTSANPGIRRDWGKKQILGKLGPGVNIRNILETAMEREFKLAANTTNVFTKQILLEIKRVEDNIALAIPLDLIKNPFVSSKTVSRLIKR
ncbi:Gfo/Idh/MocA family oxidoreductase [Candidatus Desantisbacteria bacterium]|nr:Gfo/Idh/MocA family oxidoreductase [Candidatus Desantisbacteria bacterium]